MAHSGGREGQGIDNSRSLVIFNKLASGRKRRDGEHLGTALRGGIKWLIDSPVGRQARHTAVVFQLHVCVSVVRKSGGETTESQLICGIESPSHAGKQEGFDIMRKIRKCKQVVSDKEGRK